MAANRNKTPFYLIDTQSPFYKPLWLRSAICIAVAIWALLETLAKNPFWAVISIALAAYCVYVLFLTYQPPEEPVVRAPDNEDDAGGGEEETDQPKAE